MKLHPSLAAKFVVCKPVVGAIAGLCTLSAVWAGAAAADPEQDSAANYSELSRQVEQLSETMLNAQPDLDKKMQLLHEADQQHDADMARLEVTRTQLDTYQRAVDGFAAAAYMGGKSDGLSGILTAASPTSLIEKLAIHRMMDTQITEQMQGLRRVNEEAQSIEAASAKSSADARAAADAAAALRGDMLNKQAELRTQLAAANASYAMLSPAQQAVLSPPSATVMAALGPITPIPTVGMAGVVPAARALAAYIMATFPGVQSIGGARADRLPDHPSGHALDIMIGSDMSLGDAINADLQSQAGRFGIAYTMWRVPDHFNHVHVTVS